MIMTISIAGATADVDITRDQLEMLAASIISPDNYYDLKDNIEQVTDQQLVELMNCNGDPELEDAIARNYE